MNQKLFLIVVTATLMVGTITVARATVLFSTSFDYGPTAGGLETVSGGVFVNPGGADPNTFYDPATNLTYPGYFSAGGSGGMNTGTNKPAQHPHGVSDIDMIDTTAGRYYASILLSGEMDWWYRLGSIGLVQHHTVTGDPPGHQIAYGNADYTRRLTGIQAVAPPEVSLVVLQIDSDGGAGPETVQAVVNPDLVDGLPALQAALDAAAPVSDQDFSAGDATIYHQFSRAPQGQLAYFDELRVATTLNEVIGVGTILPPSNAFVWKNDVSGNWQERGNWLGNGSSPPFFPDNNETTATFGAAITSAKTVFTNSAVTTSVIRFENTNSYTLAGGGGVNIETGSMGTSIDVLNGSHEFQTKVDFHNDAKLDVTNGSTLTFNNALNLNGNTVTKMGGGTVVINNRLHNGGGMLDVQEGIVSGSGTIGGNVENGSIIAPSDSPGVLTIDGNLNNSTVGTIAIEIDGTDGPGETQGHDQIQVTGSSTLDGTLSITTGAYTDPTIRAARDMFTVIASAGGSTGTFGTVSYDGVDLFADFNGTNGSFRNHIANGLFHNIDYDGNNVRLTNLFALEGDADGDIDIDITDFNILASHFDDTGANSATNDWTTADFDADGDIDITDFNFLAANFSDAGYAEVTTGQVPEPSTTVLMLAGVISLYLGMRRKSCERCGWNIRKKLRVAV